MKAPIASTPSIHPKVDTTTTMVPITASPKMDARIDPIHFKTITVRLREQAGGFGLDFGAFDGN